MLGWFAVALLVAGACGEPDEVATLTDTRPPAPIQPAGEMEPEMQPEPEPAPQPQPQPPPAPLEGDLGREAAAAVVAALSEAQRAVTSSRVQVHVSNEMSFDGEAESFGISQGAPYMLYTTVGDRSHIEIDQGALAALGAFGDGMPSAAPPDRPPIEIVLDGAARLAYVKLAPLAALDPSEQPAWLVDEAARRGGALDDLWGRSDLSGGALELMPDLSVLDQPAMADFLALLEAAADGGAVLAARADGPGELAGVATQVYTFVIDLATVAGDWPPVLQGFVGDAGDGGPPPADLLAALPPMPTEVTVHADAAGYVRLVRMDVDLGAILMAVFAGLGEMGGAPDDAAIALPEFEFLLSFAFEALAVNDPSLTVALPDPAHVVDLP